MSNNWNIENTPDQSGKIAIVTGANSGIGFETARQLAKKNAHVILACRNEKKGNKALNDIKNEFPNAHLELRILDLEDLNSVKTFANSFIKDYKNIDLLINNAGVMMTPESKTKQGFEMQFGVNYIGAFALTATLFDLLENTPNARIVNLSSLAHLNGKIDFDNLKIEKPYSSMREYNQSKLADLMFTLELQDRIQNKNLKTISVAAHPGLTKTELNRHSKIMTVLSNIFTQNAQMGALPTLYAAIEPKVKGGEYFGPSNFFETFGYPKPSKIAKHTFDKAVRLKLWQVGEAACGVKFL